MIKKVQAEIRNLKAVINETFRLYPPVPMRVARETTERCILEGYQIQPKMVIYVNSWAVARNPDSWNNPDELLPEIFLNGNIDIKGQDFGVIPFGLGRRICPGMYMGLQMLQIFSTLLIGNCPQEFRLKISILTFCLDV